MSQTVPDGHLFTFVYQLKNVKLLSLGSVAVLCLLAFCTMQPAQAKHESKVENETPSKPLLQQSLAAQTKSSQILLGAATTKSAPAKVAHPAQNLTQQSTRNTIAQLPSLPAQNAAPPNFNFIQTPPQQNIQANPSMISAPMLPTAPVVTTPSLNSGVNISPPGTRSNCPSGGCQSQYVASPGVMPVAAPQYVPTATQTWQEQLSRIQNYPNLYSPPVAAPQPNAANSGMLPLAPGNSMIPYGVVGQPYLQPVPGNNMVPGVMTPYGMIGQPYILVVPIAAPVLPPGGSIAPSAAPNNTSGQPYIPTTATPLPVPATPGIPQPNSIGGNGLPPVPSTNPYPAVGQAYYLPATPPLPVPATPGGNGLLPLPGTLNQGGLATYVPIPVMPFNVVPQPNAVGNGMASPIPIVGQQPSFPMVPSNTINPNYGSPYAPIGQPYLPPTPTQPPALTPIPNLPDANVTPIVPQTNTQSTAPPAVNLPLNRNQPVNASGLQLQGVYTYQGDESSARARVGAVYPLAPRILVGATLDLTDGNAFADSQTQGLSINELYLATSLENLPNLRFVIGQLDLTSYFDRNSFAKDGASQFFNSVFQTNPALVTTGLNSRPGALVNWSVTDNIEAKAAIFSSSRAIGDFALDGFATELGIRYGNAIIRGTYATDRDAGTQDGFQEAFQVVRGDGDVGIQRSDREESYGVNAEVYIPNLKMGLFGRYGRYENRDLDLGGDTYSLGVSFFDLFTPDDRLGLAYGRSLSNDKLRRQAENDRPDVLELYYDFRFLSNLRLGFTVQERNDFSETIFGFRVKTEFNVTPIESIIR